MPVEDLIRYFNAADAAGESTLYVAGDRVAVLAVLRRLGNFIAPGQAPGIILVQDWIFGQRGTLAAVTLFPGGSAILAPESLDWDVDGFTARILSPLRDAVVAARPGPARDDLDLLIGRN